MDCYTERNRPRKATRRTKHLQYLAHLSNTKKRDCDLIIVFLRVTDSFGRVQIGHLKAEVANVFSSGVYSTYWTHMPTDTNRSAITTRAI